jgi:hypothetical protein
VTQNTNAPTRNASDHHFWWLPANRVDKGKGRREARPYFRLSARTVFEKKEAPTKAVVRASVIIAARIIAFTEDPPMVEFQYAVSA